MMKTKYLVPQTEALDLQGERPMMDFGESPYVVPGSGSGSGAPGRYAPGGGDLGGIPAA